ncbi:hypothetical protein TNCV_2154401 [Trichonephila clavipes]|nr:hypothetical protein TNCV_2154401 [Trichonephila clavipes]
MASGHSLPQFNLSVLGGTQKRFPQGHYHMKLLVSSVNPTPLPHADTPRDILPRGGISQVQVVAPQVLYQYQQLWDNRAN